MREHRVYSFYFYSFFGYGYAEGGLVAGFAKIDRFPRYRNALHIYVYIREGGEGDIPFPTFAIC